MRHGLILLVFWAGFYGCKRTDTSESKWGGKAAKSAIKAGNLSDEMLATISQAVKKSVDDGEVDDLKKLIAQGGKVGDEAILAFHRSYKGLTDEWLTAMNDVNNKVVILRRSAQNPNITGPFTDAITDNIQKAEQLIDDFVDALEMRLLIVDDLADGSAEIADKLCCNSINFSGIEGALANHSGKLSAEFRRIKNIISAEQDYLVKLRASASKQSNQASIGEATTKQVDHASLMKNPDLADEVKAAINGASTDADFVAVRLAIRRGIDDGDYPELRLAMDDLLANNPAKVDDFYRSFTNRQFADIEHSLSKTIPEATDANGLYRILDELLDDFKKLQENIVERGSILRDVVNEDKLKVLHKNNRRYMAEDSTVIRQKIIGKSDSKHWLNKLPNQLVGIVNRRTQQASLGITRKETRLRLGRIEDEIKAIKKICNDGLC